MQCAGTHGKPARHGPARLLRAPLALSLLLHGLGLGAALLWAAQHDVLRAPSRIGAITLRAADEPLAVPPEPELVPLLRTQFFIVMGLVDAVPMIAVGLAMYVLFAVAG